MAILWLLGGCQPPKTPTSGETDAAAGNSAADGVATSRHAALTATVCHEVALARLADHAPGAALAWLAAALDAYPGHEDSRRLAAEVMGETRWHFPDFTFEHGHGVDRLQFAEPSSLWVSLHGSANTTVRWNLEGPRIEAVLFPIEPSATRCFAVDPTGRYALIGRAGNLLLCDAQSLKPIRELGRWPHSKTPEATIAFSPDGLLVAHPAVATDDESAVAWHIRDSQTGSILRSSEPIPSGSPSGLAASLDRERLSVLLENGSLVQMPVSPTEAAETIAQDEPVVLRHALFTTPGGNAYALIEDWPQFPPQPVMVDFTGRGEEPPLLPELLGRHPWHLEPGIWSGMLRETPDEITSRDRMLRFRGGPFAEIATDSDPTALALASGHLIAGDSAGQVTFHRLLPPAGAPTAAGTDVSPTPPAGAVAAFQHLAAFLSGLRFDPESGTMLTLGTAERTAAAKAVDPPALMALFPGIDPRPWIEASQPAQPTIPEDAAVLLHTRLDRAQPIPPPAGLAQAFVADDDEAVRQWIGEADPQGPLAAHLLRFALESEHPEWIAACMRRAENPPPLLQTIAASRIAWLEGRRADAIAFWPADFPDLDAVRLREDWDGWEAADFRPALEILRRAVDQELARLELPPEATPEQREALFLHLTDPATVQAVGKPRFAAACLRAALAFSAFPEESERTFQLASIARSLGQSPAVCLRAEALSLTALGEYTLARDRWVELITDHPLADHEPGDYAEAAYTSFENADPRQAMAILTTGIHRFPNDAHFALRAGWVALLTGHSERAYRFLLIGRQIGYPPDRLENATLLLAIAAAQSGAFEDAEVFYQELIRLDPAWQDPQTIETLEWPEELKAALRQLAW